MKTIAAIILVVVMGLAASTPALGKTRTITLTQVKCVKVKRGQCVKFGTVKHVRKVKVKMDKSCQIFNGVHVPNTPCFTRNGISR